MPGYRAKKPALYQAPIKRLLHSVRAKISQKTLPRHAAVSRAARSSADQAAERNLAAVANDAEGQQWTRSYDGHVCSGFASTAACSMRTVPIRNAMAPVFLSRCFGYTSAMPRHLWTARADADEDYLW